MSKKILSTVLAALLFVINRIFILPLNVSEINLTDDPAKN